MRTRVIFNPAAKGDKARLFRERLADIGHLAEVTATACAGDARRLAREAVTAGVQTVVAVGGDGTVNEVLNGIGDVPNGFEKTTLGVLPLGTINVFARELALPMDMEDAWQCIVRANTRRVDLPVAEFGSEAGAAPQRRYFMQLAGAGFDARAVELTDWSLKKKIGYLAYVYAGLKCMTSPHSLITVRGEGVDECTGELVLIGNGKLYGGDYAIFSRADLQDGLLEVLVFPKVNWITLAQCGPSLLATKSLPASVAKSFKTSKLTLTSSPAAPLQLDGELVGSIPATFSIQHQTLRVIAP